jgi:predicted nuclease with RNAse H fold
LAAAYSCLLVATPSLLLYTEIAQEVLAQPAMVSSDVISVGIDTTSGRKAFTFAALGGDLRLVRLAEADTEELVSFLDAQTSAVVAVNAPSHVNTGVVRKRLERKSPHAHALRGADIRAAEYELHDRGIAITATPRSAGLCPAWMQLGFVLYGKLAKLGFKPYPRQGAARQWLETHPHAGFCILLGAVPLAKPTLEGRLQRALILFENGVRIRDPMAFLEEITRHRLLHGLLPEELMLSTEQLDALVAAYTAWLAAAKPAQLTRLGNKSEGYIMLPGPELKEKY